MLSPLLNKGWLSVHGRLLVSAKQIAKSIAILYDFAYDIIIMLLQVIKQDLLQTISTASI